MLSLRRFSAGTLIFVGVGMAAGPGCGAAKALRPGMLDARTAMGETACRSVEKGGEPLVVDWKPEDRGALEITMKDAIAVVHYDCETVRLLRECSVPGNYGFVGVNRKEQMLELEDADEIRANLPFSGIGLAAKLEADLRSGQSLSIALVMVGQKASVRNSLMRHELNGECEGATHFVRRASVGAFAMRSGARAQVKSVAEAFSIGVTESSASSKSASAKDGSLESCQSSHSQSPTAPQECDALIRIELVPITSQGAALTAAPERATACPEGLVRTHGLCTRAQPGVAHLCASGDKDDCLAQCALGHPASCYQLGRVLEDAVPPDHSGAAKAFASACERGDIDGCASLGAAYMHGRGVARDPAKGVDLFRHACEAGSGHGCSNLGVAADNGDGAPKDVKLAATLFQRACDSGYSLGCTNLGLAFQVGLGVDRDLARSIALFQQACDGGQPIACRRLGGLYQWGHGVGVDIAKAASLYLKGCAGGPQLASSCVALARISDDARGLDLAKRGCDADSAQCVALGFRYETGRGVGKNLKQGAALYDRACGARSGDGCLRLARMHDRGRGVVKDVALATSLEGKSCELHHAQACRALAHRYEYGIGVSKDLVRAKDMLREACEKHDMTLACVEWSRFVEDHKVIHLLDQACEKDDIYCYALGERYEHGKGVHKDPVRAFDLYHRSCEGSESSKEGCFALSSAFEKGLGGKKDLHRALELAMKACDLDSADACVDVARRYRNGIGAPKDETRAAAYAKLACDLGADEACAK